MEFARSIQIAASLDEQDGTLAENPDLVACRAPASGPTARPDFVRAHDEDVDTLPCGSPNDLDGRLADPHLAPHIDPMFRERPCDLPQSAVRSLDEAAIEPFELPRPNGRNPLHDMEQRYARCAVRRENPHHPEHAFVAIAQVDGNHEVPEGSTAAILVLSVAGRFGPLALGTHDLSYQFDLSDPHPAVARQHGQ